MNKDGHSVKTEETNDWNIVEIWVNGERVYNCDIRKLDYGKLFTMTPFHRSGALELNSSCSAQFGICNLPPKKSITNHNEFSHHYMFEIQNCK